MRTSAAERARIDPIARDDEGRSSPLVRVMGRRDLTAAVVNTVIGSGVFGLPAAVAALTGSWSPAVVLLAGLGIFPIALCVAEVGSRFDTAGGPYLYAREAFGPAAGFHVGWLLVWTRLLSTGAVLNVLAAYLATLLPWVGTSVGRAVTMTAAVALFTAINVRGVRQAAWTINLFTVAKLLPLVLVIVLGAVHLRGDVLASQRVAAPDWTQAVLLMVFAYGGFETAVIAAGETRRPREDTAFAIVVAMVVVTAVYALTQFAVVGVLPHAALSKAPIADALRVTLGAGGAAVGSVAAVVSAYGWLTGSALLLPRIPYSMAERGELPAALARVHPAFRTPHVAIVACSLVSLAVGLAGTFTGTATISAIGRLVVYVVTCAALVALRRRRDAPPAGFVLPGGTAFAVLGIAFGAWLLSTRSLAQGWSVGAIVAAAVVVRWGTRRRRTATTAAPTS
ncbi:MAG TPA: APC family permease [Gemmatimonadaceae bacterium]|nr:APC family permease [Gemmatimonadaceae bacterium]